jgi:hypothetical protein
MCNAYSPNGGQFQTCPFDFEIRIEYWISGIYSIIEAFTEMVKLPSNESVLIGCTLWWEREQKTAATLFPALYAF